MLFQYQESTEPLAFEVPSGWFEIAHVQPQIKVKFVIFADFVEPLFVEEPPPETFEWLDLANHVQPQIKRKVLTSSDFTNTIFVEEPPPALIALDWLNSANVPLNIKKATLNAQRDYVNPLFIEEPTVSLDWLNADTQVSQKRLPFQYQKISFLNVHDLIFNTQVFPADHDWLATSIKHFRQKYTKIYPTLFSLGEPIEDVPFDPTLFIVNDDHSWLQTIVRFRKKENLFAFPDFFNFGAADVQPTPPPVLPPGFIPFMSTEILGGGGTIIIEGQGFTGETIIQNLIFVIPAEGSEVPSPEVYYRRYLNDVI